MSRNELTEQVSAKQITHKFVEQHDADVRELTVSNGLAETVIITSDEHPFYVFSKGFTAASELKTNDQLVSLDYQILKVVSNKRIAQSMPMYNFEVADYHTYAVSEQDVWVHNDCFPNISNATKHGSDMIDERGFTQNQIDNIVGNHSFKGYQPGGLTIYAKQRSGRTKKYDVIVVNKNNEIVSAIGGTKESLKNQRQVKKMFDNNGGFSGVPID